MEVVEVVAISRGLVLEVIASAQSVGIENHTLSVNVVLIKPVLNVLRR
ncbi:MAG: hypothetical protein WAV05_00940 [Anaerolineales bacterium]